jgi:hypothetical protein
MVAGRGTRTYRSLALGHWIAWVALGVCRQNICYKTTACESPVCLHASEREIPDGWPTLVWRAGAHLFACAGNERWVLRSPDSGSGFPLPLSKRRCRLTRQSRLSGVRGADSRGINLAQDTFSISLVFGVRPPGRSCGNGPISLLIRKSTGLTCRYRCRLRLVSSDDPQSSGRSEIFWPMQLGPRASPRAASRSGCWRTASHSHPPTRQQGSVTGHPALPVDQPGKGGLRPSRSLGLAAIR